MSGCGECTCLHGHALLCSVHAEEAMRLLDIKREQGQDELIPLKRETITESSKTDEDH